MAGLRQDLSAACCGRIPTIGGRLDLRSLPRLGWHDVRMLCWTQPVPGLERPLSEVVRFVSKSDRERARLIQEARAIYDSIFPPAAPVSEPGDPKR